MPAAAEAQLYAVELFRNRLRVCFDVFLARCTPELRRQMDETAEQPIHAVYVQPPRGGTVGGGYAVGRKLPYDARVAAAIADIQSRDKGPRPYCRDGARSMFYGNGMRVDGPLELEPCMLEELAERGLKVRGMRD